MISDVRYRVLIRHDYGDGFGPWRRESVEGMRVGRFAVRMKHAISVVGERDARLFIVDHVNTGSAVCDFERFDHALAFADDLSRHSERDPATRDPRRLPDQLGRAVLDWCSLSAEGGQYVAFRQWRELSAILKGRRA